jgi:hypothetical protein
LLIGERGDLDADVAQQRFLHEVLAVEQDVYGVTAFGGHFHGVTAPGDRVVRDQARGSGELAKALHDRVLPARDPFHASAYY